MEYYKSTESSSVGNVDGYSWIDASSSVYASRRRRASQQFSATAYLGHAFNACVGASPRSSSSGSVDVDPSLLRYTRPRLFSSSSSSDERPLHLRQFLHLRPPLGSSSASPLSPLRRARTPPRRSSPARGAVMEDGVLVIDGGLQEDNNNRVGGAAPHRCLLDFGSYSSTSAFDGSSTHSNSSHIRSSSGSGGFRGMAGRPRSFEELGFAMETSQMGWQASTYQSKHSNRNYAVPSASPAASGILPGMPETTRPAMPAAMGDDGFKLEVGGAVNRHSSVPCATGGPEAGATATKGSTVGARMPTNPAVPDVWRRTKEEEKLYKILQGPIPPPPPASTVVWPPTEEEAAEIERVLYGPRRWRRLPVFEQICPED